ncbi:unnamed protein product [Prunus armeniaca]|uniref:Uncharacterized protein n=1 Tax=Prunus armeniaca TaxID=36596 RepID=A0A6J5V232_PRUAR|nr:unnamed protein product [Prunus armeniaca]
MADWERCSGFGRSGEYLVAGGERKHMWWVGLLALGGCGEFGKSAGSWLLGWSVVVAGCLRLGTDGGVIRKRMLAKASPPFPHGSH